MVSCTATLILLLCPHYKVPTHEYRLFKLKIFEFNVECQRLVKPINLRDNRDVPRLRLSDYPLNQLKVAILNQVETMVPLWFFSFYNSLELRIWP